MVADRRRFSLVAPHRGRWRERPKASLAYRYTLECDVSHLMFDGSMAVRALSGIQYLRS